MTSILPKGVRFTPPPLAGRVARSLLDAGGYGGSTRVLDPACGDGELLLAVWREAGSGARLATEGLHGIERDPALARRARERVRGAIGGEAGRCAAANIQTGDALDPARPWPAGTSVVANPPWISFSGREAGSLASPHLDALRRAWPTIRPWPSLHGAFLERIARHVGAEGTRARVLLPASVCGLAGYAEGRRLLTARCRLEAAPVELGENAFPGVLEPAVLLAFRARERGGRGSTRPWEARGAPERAWAERLAGFPTLPEGSFRDPGVHTGNAAAELVVREPVSGLPGLREGRDLQPFHLAPPRLRLRTGLAPTPARRFRVAPLARYLSFPVLLRQTADRPLAALHTQPTYFRNSLLACAPPPELDPAFVVGVLNSSVAARWHRLHFRDARQRAFPQVKVSHLRTQRFPLARRGDDPKLHDALADTVRRLTGAPPPAPEPLVEELEALVRRGFGLPA